MSSSDSKEKYRPLPYEVLRLKKIEQNNERLKSLGLLSYGSFLKMKPTNANPNLDTTTVEAKTFDTNQPQHRSQQNETMLGEESDRNMKVAAMKQLR